MSDQTQLSADLGGFMFDAFRNRGRRGVLIGASIAYLVLAIVITGAFAFMALGVLGDFSDWFMRIVQNAPGAAAEPPPALSLSSIVSLALIAFLYIVVIYLVFAAYEAGCLRWLVRGQAGAFLGLTFGADMWRVWLCYWMWLVVVLGLYLACLLPIFLAAAIGTAAKNEAIGGVLAIVAGLAAACAAIWISVRLAPATAVTVALERFAFFDAWKATKGRFWLLFGAFFLLFVIYAVASQVVQSVAATAFAAPLYSALATSQGTPDPEALRAAFASILASPAAWIGVSVLAAGSLALATVLYVALFGVNARAALVARQEGRI
jgi:hypothetical protein